MAEVYTIGLGQFPTGKYPLGQARVLRRSVSIRGLRGLGDDTPNAIRIYVPRLAQALRALELKELGLQWSEGPVTPTDERWNNDLATEFSVYSRQYLGASAVVHEPMGADVIFAHMPGATTHLQAERVWARMQSAIDSARQATNAPPPPSDPYASRPRAWQTGTPALPISPGGEAAGAAPAAAVSAQPTSVADALVGATMLLLSVVL